jgi:hypothetical protein
MATGCWYSALATIVSSAECPPEMQQRRKEPCFAPGSTSSPTSIRQATTLGGDRAGGMLVNSHRQIAESDGVLCEADEPHVQHIAQSPLESLHSGNHSYQWHAYNPDPHGQHQTLAARAGDECSCEYCVANSDQEYSLLDSDEHCSTLRWCPLPRKKMKRQ